MEWRQGLKCEGCDMVGNPVVEVCLTNGALNLCKQCLNDFNAKNPQLIEARKLLIDLLAAVAHEDAGNPACPFMYVWSSDWKSLKKRIKKFLGAKEGEGCAAKSAERTSLRAD